MGTATTAARGMRLIENGFLDSASASDLAEALGVGPRHLLRLFVRHTGAGRSEIAATRRIQIAKRLIDQTGMSLAEIAFASGFGSVRRFNDAFQAVYKRPPSSFRRRRARASSEMTVQDKTPGQSDGTLRIARGVVKQTKRPLPRSVPMSATGAPRRQPPTTR